MKEIIFSKHATERLKERGVSRKEVEYTIAYGEKISVKKGREGYRKNFKYENIWKGRYYKIKQVIVIGREEKGKIVVITVYAFYFGGE